MGKIADRFAQKQLWKCLEKIAAKATKVRGMNEIEIAQAKNDPRHAHKDLTTKGFFRGLCNRRDCLSDRDVEFYNWGSYAFYCQDCARMLNRENRPWTDSKDLCNRVTEEEARRCSVM